MRFETIVTVLLSLFIGIFLLLLGGWLLIAPYYPETTGHLLKEVFLTQKAFTLGFILIGFSLLFLGMCASISRRPYIIVQMGGYSLSAKVLQQTASKVLEQFFQKEDIDCIVEISTLGKVAIIAALPYLEEEKRESTLEELEDALVHAFSSQCGFTKPFKMHVTFKSS